MIESRSQVNTRLQVRLAAINHEHVSMSGEPQQNLMKPTGGRRVGFWRAREQRASSERKQPKHWIWHVSLDFHLTVSIFKCFFCSSGFNQINSCPLFLKLEIINIFILFFSNYKCGVLFPQHTTKRTWKITAPNRFLSTIKSQEPVTQGQ